MPGCDRQSIAQALPGATTATAFRLECFHDDRVDQRCRPPSWRSLSSQQWALAVQAISVAALAVFSTACWSRHCQTTCQTPLLSTLPGRKRSSTACQPLPRLCQAMGARSREPAFAFCSFCLCIFSFCCQSLWPMLCQAMGALFCTTATSLSSIRC